jgi:hypothetical protein
LGAQAFAAYLAPLRQTKWAVYARKLFGIARVLALGRAALEAFGMATRFGHHRSRALPG